MAIIVKSLCFSFIILTSFATLLTLADARRFYVGGNGDWIINPKENFNTWAERNRFQVNDTLYFKYAKGSDSVQQVTKADFDGCNIRNPIKNFDNGESEFTFDRSGPFYFISGNQDHCKKGQKLIVVVLAVRHHRTVPISPAKPPSSTLPPQSASPVSPAKPPSNPSPSPKSPSPASSPSPSTHAPTVSPATPSPSPKSPSPSSSPSPSTHAPTVSPATPSPSSYPPKSSPSPDQAPNTSPSSEQSPPFSPSPDTTPASDNATSPAPNNKNSASVLAVTSVMTIVLSLVLTVLLFA